MVFGVKMHWQFSIVVWLETLTLAVLTIVTAQAAPDESRTIHQGRHVCVQRKQFAQPIPVRQSYRRPMYRETVQRCEDNRLCKRYSLVYGVAYRTIFHMRITTRIVHDCCPGWAQTNPRDHNCMKPVCPGGCINGGQCVGPHTCDCMEGWTGPNCADDINECAGENNCQQVCKNLQGKYECDCHDGFTLADDKVACKLCISCVPEYREMKDTITHLMKKVIVLEEEKDFLKGNMSYLADHYAEAMVTMHEIKEATATTERKSTSYPDSNSDSFPYVANPAMIPLDRIASLSEQIAMLEERLEVCTCKEYYEPKGRSKRKRRINY
ncbi:epidermal growth factor-like protein 7 [Gigantopelta aegis]|uniref:epidermal growth factor-like protein 7 n=1 Tax=Gigantopelta aegis TaxID=1735272 RepID=UPI001B888C6B|nr:epidermal growth factor-like protein 7 [Gigantopelta aegis]